MKKSSPLLCALLAASAVLQAHAAEQARPRARDVGVVIGTLPTGPRNAITDVDGVGVGHLLGDLAALDQLGQEA